MLLLLKGGIYEWRRLGGLDIETKFHKNWFSRSEVNRWNLHVDTHSSREEGDLINILLFLPTNKESRLKK
jgi:hypothetical protein